MFVPVVDHEYHPLMPTMPASARRWIRQRKATPFWKGGVWCVRLNQESSERERQPIAVGIDPGSKKEALVVKSAAHTYLNVQADAVTWVKEAKETNASCDEADETARRRAASHAPIGYVAGSDCPLQRRPAGNGSCVCVGGSPACFLSPTLWWKTSRPRR